MRVRHKTLGFATVVSQAQECKETLSGKLESAPPNSFFLILRHAWGREYGGY